MPTPDRFRTLLTPWLCAAAMVCATLWPDGAHAQSEDAPAAAIAHYHKAREHYQAGAYRQAVAELEKALKLDPSSPNLVYNVARVYELLGEIERAIQYYSDYRDMLPKREREERERVESVLQRLKGAKKQMTQPHDGPPSATLRRPPPSAPEMERGVADGAFWTLAAVGIGALAAGGTTGWFALEKEREALDFRLENPEQLETRDEHARRADTLAITTDALLIGGGALTVTAILLYSLRKQPVEQAPRGLQLSVTGHQRGGMVLLGGRL